MATTEKPHRIRFALTVGAWAALAVGAYGVNRWFFDETRDYLAPVILLVGAVQIGWRNHTRIGGEGARLLKRGLGLFMAAVGLWLWLPAEPGPPVPWQPYSPEAVEAAHREGRSVMIDFSASWCEPCQRMDRKVFSRANVVEAARQFVVLEADMSDTQSAAARALGEKYAVAGYPTVVFLGPDGAERRELRLVGYEGPNAFLKRMAKLESRKPRSKE